MEFELNSLPKDASSEQVIEEIRRVDSVVNKTYLTRADFTKHSKISPSTVSRRFGGWRSALETAGIGDKYSGRTISDKMRLQKSKYLTNEEVLNELRKIAEGLRKTSITYEDLNNSEIISAAIVRRRFGSWETGIHKAGLELSDMAHRKISDEEYFENILKVWEHHGKQPKYKEMNAAPSNISAGAYEHRFGGWRKALEAFVQRMNQEPGEMNTPPSTAKENTRTFTKINPPLHLAADIHSVSLGLRYRVLNRDHFKCVKCGASPATSPNCQLHADHVIPFSKGGKTVEANLQTLCDKCNLGKGNRHSE